MSADVVVVGGGVIGCAVAYYVARRGMSVTLVDRPRRGRATSASAGGLWPLAESLGLGCGVIFHRAQAGSTPAGGARSSTPASLPDSFRKFALHSNAMFPDLARDLSERTGMDVELEKSSLLFVTYDSADEAYAAELRERHPDVFTDDDSWDPSRLAREEPAITHEATGALRFRGDDQINPYRLADALRAAARGLGAVVVPHTDVVGIGVSGGRVVHVRTSAGEIPCRTVVNAAGAWAGAVGAMVGIDVPVRPVRGQLVATQALPRVLHACISTSDCYLAQKAHGEVIVGSTTEDTGFDTDVTSDALHTLCAGAVRAIPALARASVKRAWAGLRPGSPDELPMIGPVAGVDGYLAACGHFRTGILTAPATGAVLASLAAGEIPDVPIAAFAPDRFARSGSVPGADVRK